MQKKLLFLLLVFPLNIFAQQCAYDNYYLFVVNVHSSYSQDKIPGLKMYLTDETGKPITAESQVQVNKKWVHRTDTLFFWDNQTLSKNDGTRPLIRRKFYHVGDCYLVAFRLNHLTLKDPLTSPIYYLKIEAGINELTNQSYPMQTFHLPLNKSVRICNNGVLEHFKLVKPVETFDGKPFNVIDIVLNQDPYQMVVGDEESPENTLKYSVRFEYTNQINAVAYNREEFIVKGAKIYDSRNGKLHQQFDIPSKAVGVSETYNHLTEWGDYYQREISEAKDFSVTIDSWRDSIFGVERKKTNFYIFNTQTKKYELDSLLSRETDAYYHPPQKTMRRLEYLLTEKSKTTNTYELQRGSWKLIDKREELFPAYIPKLKPNPSACILFDTKHHQLPLHAVIGTNAKVKVKDSFQLYNACENPIHIISVKSPTRDFFRIDQTLLPGKYTTLKFEGEIINSGLDFRYNSFNCYLTLEDNSILPFSIDIPVVSNNSQVFYRSDSSIAYTITRALGNRFSKAIFSHLDGSIRAIGMVQDGDTSLKIGKWQYYKQDERKMTEFFYSKSVCISALNQTMRDGNHSFRIKLLQNGIWNEPISQLERGGRCIYLTEATDSIVAYNDSMAYGFSLPYQKLPENIEMQLYLLKPGERTLKIGYYQTPFNTIRDQYIIIPNYSIARERFKSTHQIRDSSLRSLQLRFPKIAEVYISKNSRGISLEGMRSDEKKNLLAVLAADSGIAFVSQVIAITDKEATTYCNNEVFVELNGNHSEDLKKMALSLGFSDMQAEMGNNRYGLKYASKMIDERFFDAYEKLTKLPGVVGVFLNTYFEAQLD